MYIVQYCNCTVQYFVQYYTTYCNCTVQSTVIVLCTVLYRENTEYLDLFIIVDETEFQQGQEYFFFPKIISIIRRVNNNT